MTKKQWVEKVVRQIQGFVDQKGILDTKSIQHLKLLHGINTDRVVASAERFLVPAFEQNLLLNYVRAELEKAQFFSYKLRGASEDPEIQAKLMQASKQLQKLSESDIHWLCGRLAVICKVIKS